MTPPNSSALLLATTTLYKQERCQIAQPCKLLNLKGSAILGQITGRLKKNQVSPNGCPDDLNYLNYRGMLKDSRDNIPSVSLLNNRTCFLLKYLLHFSVV